MDTNNQHLIEALKAESGELNGRIQEVYKSMYALFGTILPAVLTVFALVDKDVPAIWRGEVVFMFVAVISLASMWSSALGMELITFLRYRYVVFQPRLYVATGQLGEDDLGTFSLTGHRLRWIPAHLVNLLLLIVSFGAASNYIPGDKCALRWTAYAFLAAAIASVAMVQFAQRRSENELKRARDERRQSTTASISATAGSDVSG